jgi:cytochrome c5
MGLLAVGLSTGCDANRAASAGAVAVTSATLARPADAKLAEQYERSCATCHATPGSGAPLRADRKAWSAIETTGDEAMLSSVRRGKGAMPPMGLCPDCSDDELRRLIDFLRGTGPA